MHAYIHTHTHTHIQVLESLIVSGGEGADLTDEEKEEHFKRYEQLLGKAMNSVSCHFIYPLVYASLRKQSMSERVKAQEEAHKSYNHPTAKKLPGGMIETCTGMPDLFRDVKSILGIESARDEMCAVMRGHKTAIQARMGAKRFVDKGKKLVHVKKMLGNDSYGKEHLDLEPEFEQWFHVIRKEHEAFVHNLKSKVITKEKPEFEARLKVFEDRYEDPRKTQIPRDFFSPPSNIQKAGPQALIKVYFDDAAGGDFNPHVLEAAWSSHVEKCTKLTTEALIQKVRERAVASIRHRWEECDVETCRTISENVCIKVQEVVKDQFLSMYESSGLVTTRGGRHTTSRKLFAAARRIFTEDVYRRKADVITAVREKSCEVKGLMAEELFEAGQKPVGPNHRRKPTNSPLGCINDIMTTSRGVYAKAQKEASKLFCNQTKDLDKELPEAFLKAIVDALDYFEQAISSSKATAMEPWQHDVTSRVLSPESSLPCGTEVRAEFTVLPAETIDAINRAANEASGNIVDASRMRLPYRSRIFNPRGDGHCGFRALAALKYV
jgi:hypothetical protein